MNFAVVLLLAFSTYYTDAQFQPYQRPGFLPAPQSQQPQFRQYSGNGIGNGAQPYGNGGYSNGGSQCCCQCCPTQQYSAPTTTTPAPVAALCETTVLNITIRRLLCPQQTPQYEAPTTTTTTTTPAPVCYTQCYTVTVQQPQCSCPTNCYRA